MKPLYLQEFPNYDDTLPTLEGFSDSSWHNDVCPSISDDNDSDPEECIFIFCDYKEKTRKIGRAHV